MMTAKNVVLYLLVPALNVLFWYYRALDSDVLVRCATVPAARLVVSPASSDVGCVEDNEEEEEAAAAASRETFVEVRGSADGRLYRPRRDMPASCADTQLDLDIYTSDHDHRVHQWKQVQHPSEVEGGEPPPPTSAMLSSFLSTVSTAQLDSWRAERMASMTYASGQTVLLHSSSGGGGGGGGEEGEKGEEGEEGEEEEAEGSGATRHQPGRETRYKGKVGHISGGGAECTSIDMQWVSTTDSRCLAVVKVQGIAAQRAYAIQRFDKSVDENNKGEKDRPEPHHPIHAPFKGNKHNAGKARPIGFFRKVPAERGFQRTREKLGPFVQHHDGPGGIAAQLDAKLALHGISKGDDATLMVVNEGEVDLWLNFACSCQQNHISMRNVFVFCGSEEIIPLIESTGAAALFHKGYASVSKKASKDYLDRVFVDMMWYKAFSVYLMTSRGINILFQDVDLVWFRDPMPYFKEYAAAAWERSNLSGSHPEAFFSDDGQRSLRYSPFFANSGFYYLLGTPKSASFAWSIMITFDAVQVLGSHQNVFTMKLVEGLALGAQHSVILPIYKFPTGILYHHDRKYMRRLKQKKEDPYGFHMCWTQGKPDKLKYLRLASMWYLTPQCSPLENLIEGGRVHAMVQHMSGGKPALRGARKEEAGGPGGEGGEGFDKWYYGIESRCCSTMDGGPGLSG